MATLTRIALIVAGLHGCGDGLQPTGFRGAPVHTVNGTLEFGIGDVDPNYRYGLFWATDPGAPQWRLDPATVDVFLPPARFTTQIYEVPPVGPDGYAVGAFLVWRDADLDGRKGADEDWVGGAISATVVYAEQALAADKLTTLPVPAGFTDQVAPLLCDAEPLPFSAPSCPHDVTRDCTGAIDCDFPGAVCVESAIHSQLPSGLCVLLAPPEEEEEPGELDPFEDEYRDQLLTCTKNARLVPFPGGSRLLTENARGIWLPACTRAGIDGCPEGWMTCSASLGICMPPPAFDIVAGGDNRLPSFCLFDFENRLEQAEERAEDQTEQEEQGEQ